MDAHTAALLGAGLVGLLLPGANAVVSVAEQHVPSSLAALLISELLTRRVRRGLHVL